MGNLLGITIITISIAFALFVIYKLIKAGIDDSNNAGDDKSFNGGGSGDNPSPKNYEK